MAERLKRKISAILSADVAGYSRLMETDEESTVRTMESYRKSVSALIEQHNGRVVDSPGDNLLAEFASVVDATQCAVEIQHAIKAKNSVVPEARRMQFRIGISLEDVINENGRLYGDGVNIAARIEGLADPGGICISSSAYEQIKRKLALGYEDLGEHSVKNISWPVQVYRIPIDGDHKAEKKQDVPQAASEKPSIGVLPFDNFSSDPEQEYFVDGMTDEIISRLSMNSMLAVISRNSTFFYKGKQIKIKQIAEELGVRYIVEGSVRKDQNKVRITAKLIDATTEGHTWSRTYDRELKEVFALQDEIAQQVVAALYVEYKEAEIARVRRIPTKSLTAYDFVLQGLEYLQKQITKEGTAKAREMFERAIELDPQYAVAYSYLSATYLSDFIWWGWEQKALEQSFRIVRKAISLDDSVLDGHANIGNIYKFQGKYELALAETEKALSLNPNDAWAYVIITSINNVLGRYEKALEAMSKAMRLNPHYDIFYLTELAYAYNGLERYGDAIESLNKALAMNPDYVWTYTLLGSSYQGRGEYEDAIATYKDGISRNPDYQPFYVNLVHAYWRQWYTQQNEDPLILDKAFKVAKQGVELDERSVWGHLALNTIYKYAKRYDEAIQAAEKAVAVAPQNAQSYAQLSDALSYAGRMEEAIEMAERARQIDSAVTFPSTLAYRLTGRFDDALALAKQSGAGLAFYEHIELAILYSELGRLDDAKAEAAEVLKLIPNFSVDVHGQKAPFKDPAQTERDIASLRKAGLK